MRQLPFTVRIKATSLLLPALLVGCRGEEAKACRGAEQCECYGNGSCDDGLTCLSNHCVDLTPDDAAAEDIVADAALDASFIATDAAVESDTPSTNDASVSTRAHSSAATTGTAVSETDASTPSTTASNSTHGNSSTVTDVESTTTTEASSEDNTSSAQGTSESTATTEGTNSTSTDATSSSDTTSSDTSADSSNTASSDTDTSDEPLEFPPLPERNANALDETSPNGDVASNCASPQASTALCYSNVACTAPCTASLDWMWATVDVGSDTQTLSLYDLSGDGTVLIGNWETLNAATNRRMFVLRWGKAALKFLAPDFETFGTAINFDATAAAGSIQPCIDQSCDYVGMRWTNTTAIETPIDLGQPNDISDGLVVVGYGRNEDEVLQSYIWQAGEPTIAQNLALQNLSGDGQSAAGTVDGGSVALYYANGTKSIPTTGTYRADACQGVSVDGSVVVGYGWDQQALNSPMYRWLTNETHVDVIQPLPGFTDIVPFGVDASGDVIVGVDRQNTPTSDPADTEAFYWDATTGVQALTQKLAARGIAVPAGMYLQEAYVSADASTIVGKGSYQSSPIIWRVRLAR